ncbi:hypothetical protein JNUCC71_01425 [Carnobacterium divergens]|uniref:hypothetical protein n=1 Tax=Carnobacterium divergens TaxID=2748 RepID=UPI0039B0E216
MTDKKYTHKIVMYDVNGLVRTARFESENQAIHFIDWAVMQDTKFASDNSGIRFNMNNIVQINPFEVIEHD